MKIARAFLSLALFAAFTFAFPCSGQVPNVSKSATSPYLPTSAPFIGDVDNQFGPGFTFQMATGDFNEDGKTDIVLVDGGVALLLSNGDGTFSTTDVSNFPPLAYQSPMSVAVGDINHDGHLDLVVFAYYQSGDPVLLIALGSGDGTFGDPARISMVNNGCASYYSVSAYFSQITIADFNGDGNPDWIVSCPTLTVYFGDGHGGVSSTHELSGTGPIVAGDFNGDRISDFAALQDKETAIFLGKADGTFIAAGHPLISVKPVLAGDFNEDGKFDLVVQSLDGLGSILYFGNGDGSFDRGPKLPATLQSDLISSALAGDFNRDGHLDIAFLIPFDFSYTLGIPLDAGSTKVLFGKGDGTFTASPTYVGGDAPGGLVAANLTGHGELDLVTATLGYSGGGATASVGTLLNNGDGTFEGAYTVLNTGINNVAAGDFNNDNKLDIVAVSPGGLSVVLGNGDGTFQAPIDVSADNVQAVAVGDFNNDGNLDVVTGTDTQLTLYVGDGHGDLKVFSSCQCGIGGNFNFHPQIGVADFNDDGNLDVAVSNPVTNTIAIDFGDGKGHFRRGPVLQLASFFPLATSANGEIIHKGGNDTHKGENDIVTGICVQQCSSDGTGTTGLFLNSGNGEFQPVSTSPFSIFGFPTSIVVGDFNNDGKSDLLVSTLEGLGAFYLFLGNGDGTFQSPSTITSVSPQYRVLGGDFNGDGNLDFLAIGNAAYLGYGTQEPTIAIYYGAGNGTFTASEIPMNAGILGSIGVVGDFNGDGSPDFMENNTVLHLNSGGTYIQFQADKGNSGSSGPEKLTANVAASYRGALMPQPTGSVTFKDLSAFPVRTLGVGNLVSGTAEAVTSGLAPGIHMIEPVYSGDANFHSHIGSAIQLSISSADSSGGSTTVASSTPTIVELLSASGGFGGPTASSGTAAQSNSGSVTMSDIGPRPLSVRGRSRARFPMPQT